MSRDAELPPGPELWQAANLRLISFPVEPQITAQQDWFRHVSGNERESRSDKRNREVQEQGSAEGQNLALSIDLLRLTWTLSPNPTDDHPFDLPAVGQFLEWSARFRHIMHRWLEITPPISRLTFAATLLIPTDDRLAGYGMMNRYLRCVDLSPDSSDFMYRINRTARSSNGLAINRLTTWAVMAYKGATSILGQGLPTRDFDIGHACSLELDINNVPSIPSGELPREILCTLFDDMVAMGVDIATHGDRMT